MQGSPVDKRFRLGLEERRRMRYGVPFTLGPCRASYPAEAQHASTPPLPANRESVVNIHDGNVT